MRLLRGQSTLREGAEQLPLQSPSTLTKREQEDKHKTGNRQTAVMEGRRAK
jgi:hypothetical protein